MRKLNRAARAAALLSVLAGVAACGSDSKSESTATSAAAATGSAAASTGGVTCKDLSLAFMGATSGDAGALGQPMLNAVTLRVDAWNAANPDCQIAVKDFDTQGDPAQAAPIADKVVGDKTIVGLVGPAFSGETKATMPKFEEAGLPMVSPSATNAKLSQSGWKMFHRVVANDDRQAPMIVALLNSKGYKKVGVIDDGSEYGKGLSDGVKAALGANLADSDTIDPKASDYSAAVNKMKGAGVDAVFYSGYYGEAAKLVKQLRDAGVTAQFVGPDGISDTKFIEGAGAAAEGAIATNAASPVDANKDFYDSYKAKFNVEPGIYAAEAFDSTGIFLDAIKAGHTDRASIATFVSAYDAAGITKQLKFTPEGEIAGDAFYWYLVTDGKLVSQGLIKG